MAELAPVLWGRILDFDLLSHAYWAEQIDWPGVTVFYSPDSAASNLAILGRVSPGEADATLNRIVAFYAQRSASPRVWVTPLSEPSDWPRRLTRHGFQESSEREVYMTLAGGLTRLPNPAVEIRRAPAEISVETFVQVQDAGFGIVGDSSRSINMARRNLERRDWAFYVALLYGEAVGAASALYGAGIAGIWGVTTLPEARRQGVSASLLSYIVAEARRRSVDTLYLSANPTGYARGLYNRLGFVEQFETRVFERGV